MIILLALSLESVREYGQLNWGRRMLLRLISLLISLFARFAKDD